MKKTLTLVFFTIFSSLLLASCQSTQSTDPILRFTSTITSTKSIDDIEDSLDEWETIDADLGLSRSTETPPVLLLQRTPIRQLLAHQRWMMLKTLQEEQFVLQAFRITGGQLMRQIHEAMVEQAIELDEASIQYVNEQRLLLSDITTNLAQSRRDRMGALRDIRATVSSLRRGPQDAERLLDLVEQLQVLQLSFENDRQYLLQVLTIVQEVLTYIVEETEVELPSFLIEVIESYDETLSILATNRSILVSEHVELLQATIELFTLLNQRLIANLPLSAIERSLIQSSLTDYRDTLLDYRETSTSVRTLTRNLIGFVSEGSYETFLATILLLTDFMNEQVLYAGLLGEYISGLVSQLSA